jgi:hypothetical protein
MTNLRDEPGHCRGVMVDLSEYRSRRRASRSDPWRDRQEFCTSFAAYLRERVLRVESDFEGCERLAVAFDLRCIRLVRVLTSMLSDERLMGQAAHTLGLARSWAAELAPGNRHVPSACAAVNDLADALDMVGAVLGNNSVFFHARR